LPDIIESGRYTGTQYDVYPTDSTTGDITKHPYKQYFDMDGNGRIDFIK
jgi:hypothetical protein